MKHAFIEKLLSNVENVYNGRVITNTSSKSKVIG